MAIETRPIMPNFGAEIRGVDLRSLSDADLDAIMTAFDGWMVDHHGINGMLYGELWLQVLAGALFLFVARMTRPKTA